MSSRSLLRDTPDLSQHTVLFVGGLHRSGTSVVHDLIRAHPRVSGFSNTGVPKDEGQHLQTVMAPARAYGGPGRFAFHAESHLTEAAPLSSADRDQLLRQWGAHWDLQSPVLVEKSPPNLIRARFLSRVFPQSRILFVVRHPVPVSIATMKWSGTTPLELLLHWHVAHAGLIEDLTHVGDRSLVVRYEDLVTRTDQEMRRVWNWLSLDDHPSSAPVDDRNVDYFCRWEDEFSVSAKQLEGAFPDAVSTMATFGYALHAPYVHRADVSRLAFADAHSSIHEDGHAPP